jgi:hypothetical protein
MTTLFPHQVVAISEGYFWECACGEIYRTRENACVCRKCREYLVDFHDRSAPVDLRTIAVQNG